MGQFGLIIKKRTMGFSIKRAILSPFIKFSDEEYKYLFKAKGVVHVGANLGQERDVYKTRDLNVIWVEPIPTVFQKLEENIKSYKKQIALNALVTLEDGKEHKFNLSNNEGQSSSILEMADHSELWPEVHYMDSISIKGVSLTTLMKSNKIDLDNYDVLILDAQGAELLILKGAVPIIREFKYIQTEVPDFEAYKDCCVLSDIREFMKEHGFVEEKITKFADHKNVGSYYDVLFKRT